MVILTAEKHDDDSCRLAPGRRPLSNNEGACQSQDQAQDLYRSDLLLQDQCREDRDCHRRKGIHQGSHGSAGKLDPQLDRVNAEKVSQETDQ